MQRFKIRTRDKRLSNFWFWVYIHDSIKEMRDIETQYRKEEKLDFEDYSDCYGLCHPYERSAGLITEGKKKGQHRLHPNIGYVRLSKDYLSTEIVCHEILHAALWMYRCNFSRNANFGNECSQKEEDICHLYGQLFTFTTKRLHELGLWK